MATKTECVREVSVPRIASGLGSEGSAVNAPPSSLGIFQVQEIQEDVGRGGGDRNDKLANKACALSVLQPPPLSNWNKRNRPWGAPASGARNSIPTTPCGILTTYQIGIAFRSKITRMD